jgi:hypothetical protein
MLAFICLAMVLVFANVYLFMLYRLRPGDGRARRTVWAPSWSDFDPQHLGGFSYWQLALVSVTALFLELLMIRWISSEIRVFAYFKNFVLIACFLGFGLGCYLCRRSVKAMAWFVPLLVIALVIALPWPQLRELLRSMPTMIGALSEVDAWGVPSLPRSVSENLTPFC